MTKKGIVIIDYGSQYTQLIARRVRELGVFSRIVHCSTPIKDLLDREPIGLILSGGPNSVYDKDAPQLDKELLTLGLPILGICYGMQLLAHSIMGQVASSSKREYGHCKVAKTSESILFQGVPESFTVWMSHGDKVLNVADKFRITISSDNCPIAAIEDAEQKIFGLQFHPEVIHTQHGMTILSNFVFEVCKCQQNWLMDEFINELIDSLKKETREGKVLAAVSGGVDSTVLSYVLYHAIGDRMIGIFIDNGLLRKKESEKVRKRFELLKIPVDIVDASHDFLDGLKGIIDPEKKRRIIGDTFVKVFKRYSKQIPGVSIFAQGTLYPDVVESGGSIGPSSVIKTHHNLVDEVKQMGFKVIEPFRELFKDEVRKIGKILSIPEEIINQHPFPGPGLAVRMIGEITPERLELLRDADEILIEEVEAAGYYDVLWQCFPVLLPVKTVGVMGDQRSYGNVVAIRAIKSTDGMTADWVLLPYEVLNKISSRIVNEIKGINRVVYDITNKPPATIEWE